MAVVRCRSRFYRCACECCYHIWQRDRESDCAMSVGYENSGENVHANAQTTQFVSSCVRCLPCVRNWFEGSTHIFCWILALPAGYNMILYSRLISLSVLIIGLGLNTQNWECGFHFFSSLRVFLDSYVLTNNRQINFPFSLARIQTNRLNCLVLPEHREPDRELCILIALCVALICHAIKTIPCCLAEWVKNK